MRPISDQDFYWATRRSTPVHLKGRADELSDLAPPTIKSFGRLIGRMEEGKSIYLQD